jgi:hypothetical protein
MAGGGPIVVKVGGSQAFSRQLTEPAGKNTIACGSPQRASHRAFKYVPGVGRP